MAANGAGLGGAGGGHQHVVRGGGGCGREVLLLAGHHRESKLGRVGWVLEELSGSWLIGPGSFLTPVSLLLLDELLLLAELV